MLCSKDSCMPVSTDSVQKENRVREENFVKALVRMRNAQDFDDYCFEQGISDFPWNWLTDLGWLN